MSAKERVPTARAIIRTIDIKILDGQRLIIFVFFSFFDAIKIILVSSPPPPPPNHHPLPPRRIEQEFLTLFVTITINTDIILLFLPWGSRGGMAGNLELSP